MHTVVIIDNIPITFSIGKNMYDNHEIILEANPNDLWVHFDGLPSSHIIAHIHEMEISRKMKLKIIKQATHLLKQKMKHNGKIVVTITNIQNVICIDKPGQVITSNTQKMLL